MPLALGFQASMKNLKTNSKQLKIKWSTSLLKVVLAHMLAKFNIHKLDISVLIRESNFFAYVMPTKVFYDTCFPYLSDILLRCRKFIDTTQETPHLISDYPKTKKLCFPYIFNCAIHDWNSLPN